MESTVHTLRVDAKTKMKLDKLAQATESLESFLAAEAIERYRRYVEDEQINTKDIFAM